jgi:hypothetical protein
VKLEDLNSQQTLTSIFEGPVITSSEQGFVGADTFAPLDKSMKAYSADNYFKSYEKLHTHRLMLADEARTFAYKDALE